MRGSDPDLERDLGHRRGVEPRQLARQLVRIALPVGADHDDDFRVRGRRRRDPHRRDQRGAPGRRDAPRSARSSANVRDPGRQTATPRRPRASSPKVSPASSGQHELLVVGPRADHGTRLGRGADPDDGGAEEPESHDRVPDQRVMALAARSDAADRRGCAR